MGIIISIFRRRITGPVFRILCLLNSLAGPALSLGNRGPAKVPKSQSERNSSLLKLFQSSGIFPPHFPNFNVQKGGRSDAGHAGRSEQ